RQEGRTNGRVGETGRRDARTLNPRVRSEVTAARSRFRSGWEESRRAGGIQARVARTAGQRRLTCPLVTRSYRERRWCLLTQSAPVVGHRGIQTRLSAPWTTADRLDAGPPSITDDHRPPP